MGQYLKDYQKEIVEERANNSRFKLQEGGLEKTGSIGVYKTRIAMCITKQKYFLSANVSSTLDILCGTLTTFLPVVIRFWEYHPVSPANLTAMHCWLEKAIFLFLIQQPSKHDNYLLPLT